MKKTNLILALIALSSSAAYAGGTVAPAPAEAPAAPAPAPYVAPAPAPAPAVVAPVFVPSWYAGIGIGQSKIKDVNSGTFSNNGVTASVDDTSTSYKVFAGYRFHPNFAVELGYVDLGKGTASATGTNGGAPASISASVNARAVTLDAVGILPFANAFEAFAKVGGYYARTTADVSWVNVPALGGTGSASASDNNGGFHYGIGAGYNFNRSWAARVEWERFNSVGGDKVGGKSDVDNTSVSVLYKF